jgi:hypothetical protein
MKSTIEVSRRVFRSTVLHRVGSRRLAELAARLGATHASFGAEVKAPVEVRPSD